MQEIFKPVRGYEGLYEVSNLGRVRSLERVVKVKYQKTVVKADGTRRTVEVRTSRRFGGQILKPKVSNKGYLRVFLWKDGKETPLLVHRLVADAYIPNPENKPQINHLDGNKRNNRVENLERVTASENMKHAVRTGLNKPPKPTYHLTARRDKRGRFVKKVVIG